MREALHWAAEMDLDQSPPVMAQRIHRRLRVITGVDDPYRAAKTRLNQIAIELLPAIRTQIQTCEAPLLSAARIAIAGNMIDMGINGNVTEMDVNRAVQQALTEPFWGNRSCSIKLFSRRNRSCTWRIMRAKSLLTGF